MKEKPNFKKKGFIPKNHKVNDNPDKLQISQITRANNGESAILEGIIERIVQTPGPTIF
jgi:RecJ-like exonuclease